MIQHQVTGNNDQSMTAIAKLYGVGWKDVGNATFGKWGASYVYPWLEQNGGQRGAADNVPTKYHWFWRAGMVVNVPTDKASLSPPTSSGVPGGPLVTVSGMSGDPLPGQEQAPDQEAYLANEEETIATADQQSGLVPEGTSVPPATTPEGAAKAGVGAGAGSLFTFLLVGAAIYFLMNGKKKGRRGRRSKRTTRRRRR